MSLAARAYQPGGFFMRRRLPAVFEEARMYKTHTCGELRLDHTLLKLPVMPACAQALATHSGSVC